jgi:hypothetical protein
MGSSTRPRIRRGEGAVLQLRVELTGVHPTIWRLLLVSERASLLELHGAIQRALGTDASPEHAFEVDGVRYADPEACTDCTTEETDLASLGLVPGSRLLHEVATEGEPWRHVVTVEQVSPRLVGQRLPVCLAGERASPPDDIEGPARFQHLLAALDAPLDARTAELRDWLGEDFDPAFVDLTTINAQLARMPRHRPAA